MGMETTRSDEIVTAFAGALFAQQMEGEEIVTLELADVLYPRENAAGAAYDGPPRAARKHAP